MTGLPSVSVDRAALLDRVILDRSTGVAKVLPGPGGEIEEVDVLELVDDVADPAEDVTAAPVPADEVEEVEVVVEVAGKKL
jgi:hypothetical protein